MKFRLLILAFLLLVFPLFSSTLLFSGQAEILGQWQRQLIETDADFRGLCAVNGKVAWVSGTRGTFGRTVDGGKTWQVGVVAGAEKLDFRDVEAFGEETAYLMAAGPGPASRIYKTIDGGKTWDMQFQCTDKMAFLDSMAFWDKDHGIAMGDPVGGKNQLIATEDGGAHWVVLPSDQLPLSLPKEGAFAASGTCLVTQVKDRAYFVTGGAVVARVFHSGDRGKTWEVTEAPVKAGNESSGIFSIGWRNQQVGLVVGGDYRKPESSGATAAITRDGGKSWKGLSDQLPFCSAVAWAGGRWVAVGTAGSFESVDDGDTWKRLDRGNYNAVHFTPDGAGWAAGPKGMLVRFLTSPSDK